MNRCFAKYSILSQKCLRQPIFGSRITTIWKPHTVLIEPTILPEEKTNKRADLILFGQRDETISPKNLD